MSYTIIINVGQHIVETVSSDICCSLTEPSNNRERSDPNFSLLFFIKILPFSLLSSPLFFYFSFFIFILFILQEHQRSQREQWEIRQLDHELLQQRHSERERERELKELAEQKLLLADDQDDFNLHTA